MATQPPLDPPVAGAAKVRWIATCPDETKGVLIAELEALGVREPRSIYRGAAFEATLEDGYRAHLWLRTASRVQRVVADLPAGSAAALEAGAAAIGWSAWLLARPPLAVSPILTDEAAKALGEPAVKAALAAGIARSFAAAGLPAPPVVEAADGAVTLVAHLRKGVCTLGLDTAGRALHKRGWRLGGHPAVLKETLAAAVLLLAGYDGTEPLLDPMCGSGTLVIEGAYLALHKAPLIHRGKDDFGFEHQAGFDRALWRRVSEQAREARLAAPPAPIFASDLRADFVALAQRTALRARVERYITFSTASLYHLAPPAPQGLLVANLPYGERIGRGQFAALYQEMGRTLRTRLRRWRAALLVPAAAPGDALGLRARRDLPLLNGALEVRLLLIDAAGD